MSKPNFTGVILAGGASRRMGTDKTQLRLHGTPLLDLMRRKLVAAGAANIVVLGRPDKVGGLADKQPGAGPVVAAMQYLEQQPLGSKHLFVPVDMPALEPLRTNTLARQPYWAHFTGYNLPFLGLADGIKLDPPRRLYDLLMIKMARRLAVNADGGEAFINLNSPQDYINYTGNSAALVTRME